MIRISGVRQLLIRTGVTWVRCRRKCLSASLKGTDNLTLPRAIPRVPGRKPPVHLSPVSARTGLSRAMSSATRGTPGARAYPRLIGDVASQGDRMNPDNPMLICREYQMKILFRAGGPAISTGQNVTTRTDGTRRRFSMTSLHACRSSSAAGARLQPRRATLWCIRVSI